MNVEENTSTLFQTQLRPEDVTFFENPANQPQYNPMNCGAVSGQLLGLVSKRSSEIMTAEKIGMGIQEWVDEFNKISDSPVYSHNLVTLRDIETSLFPGFATLVLFTRLDDLGHYCVVAKDSKNEIYILDPQSRIVVPSEKISEYFKEQSFTDLVYVIRTPPRTKEEHLSAYIDEILSSQLSECRLGGKRKRSTRKRKTRSLRKRNTRKRR